MDLLAGYGSGSDEETEVPAADVPAVSSVPSGPSASVDEGKPEKEKGSKGSKAGAGGPQKRRILLKMPPQITLADLREPWDEDEQPSKKRKNVSASGMSLTQFLPKPKQDSSRGRGAGKAFQRDASPDSDGGGPELGDLPRLLPTDVAADVVDDVPKSSDGYQPGQGQSADEKWGAGLWGSGAQPKPGVQQYPDGFYDGAAGSGGQSSGQFQSWQEPAAGPSGEPVEDAWGAEERKVAIKERALDPFADTSIKFKEVNQAQLTQMNPAARQAINATRTAFGNDYEARLRAEAGAAPDKTSKRKHQLGSLFHQAKTMELEMLERRTQSQKTKSETQAKYGW